MPTYAPFTPPNCVPDSGSPTAFSPPNTTPDSGSPVAFTPPNSTADTSAPVPFTPANITPDSGSTVAFTPPNCVKDTSAPNPFTPAGTPSNSAPVTFFPAFHDPTQSVAWLQAQVTAPIAAGSNETVIVVIGSNWTCYALTAGSFPGGSAVQPNDYNATTNAKFWAVTASGTIVSGNLIDSSGNPFTDSSGNIINSS